MQRWSIGHSRRRHGAQAVSSRTTRARSETGEVSVQSVEPKTATSGVPESGGEVHGPRVVRQQDQQVLQHAHEIAERRLAAQDARGCPELPGDRLAEGRSAAPPTIATLAPVRRATRSAAAAKRSGRQRLAVP